MRVYIQKVEISDKDVERGKTYEFADDWVFAAYLGAQKLGMQVIFFTDDELDRIPKNQLVIADIDTTISYFNRTGIKVPFPLNIPFDIEKYAKRDTLIVYLDELIDYPINFKFPLFVKPQDTLKGIPSGVLKKGDNDMRAIFSDVVDKHQLIRINPVINMESEWRTFVHDKKIVGLEWYQGDFTIFPDVSIIKKMIDEYTSAPVAYTLDVAITDKGETILIECNDAWSIGNYGLEGKTYIRLLIDRWRQMLSNAIKNSSTTNTTTNGGTFPHLPFGSHNS